MTKKPAEKKESQEELKLDEKNKKDSENTGDNEEIVIVEEEKEKEKVSKKEESKEDEVEKRIQALEERIEKERKDKEAALKRADTLEKERKEEVNKKREAEGKAASTQKQAIEDAIKAASFTIETQRKAYKDALEAGDSDKVVDANEKHSEAVYLLSELKKNKLAFEQWEKQQEENAKRAKETTLPPSVQEWIDRNPKYNTDSIFKAEADTAHDAALRRGYAFGSVAYIEFIDGRIEKIFGKEKEDLKQEEDDDNKDQSTQKKGKESTYSAPPNRGSGGHDTGQSGGKKIYKLTAAQREAAAFMNMSEVEYAKFLEAEKNRG